MKDGIKVKDLIEKLQKVNPELPVFIDCPCCEIASSVGTVEVEEPYCWCRCDEDAWHEIPKECSDGELFDDEEKSGRLPMCAGCPYAMPQHVSLSSDLEDIE